MLQLCSKCDKHSAEPKQLHFEFAKSKNIEHSRAVIVCAEHAGHTTVRGVLQVLLEIREENALHQYSQATAYIINLHRPSFRGYREFVEARPALKAALQKRVEFQGPSGTEMWLYQLKGEQLQTVLDLAQWALSIAEAEGQFGCKPNVIELQHSKEDTAADGLQWNWTRARVAVNPYVAYPVLGRALDAGKALALPNLERLKSSARKAPTSETAPSDTLSSGEHEQEQGLMVDGVTSEHISNSELLSDFDEDVDSLPDGSEAVEPVTNTLALEQTQPTEIQFESEAIPQGAAAEMVLEESVNSSGAQYRPAVPMNLDALAVDAVKEGGSGKMQLPGSSAAVSRIVERMRGGRLAEQGADKSTPAAIGINLQPDTLVQKEGKL
jgi:hypothetical protein